MFPRTLSFMLVCAGIGYFLGRSRGMGLQGFFLGLAFGPIGWGLTLLWPTRWIQGPVPRDVAGRGQEFRRPAGPGGPGPSFRSGPVSEGDRDGSGQRENRFQEGFRGGPACPRCGRAVGRDAGACPHCGNVLIPVSYRVG